MIAVVPLATSVPGAAYAFIWPALTSSLIWIVALIAGRTETKWSTDWITTLAALPLVVMLLPFLPGVIMSDGMKSLNILAGVEIALFLPSCPPLMVCWCASPPLLTFFESA